MTLENLLKVGSIRRHKPSRTELLRLLSAARRSLIDAAVPQLSAGSRFDIAYKAIMQCALLAMMANGFRPASSTPGHHAIVIQSLPKTLGIPGERMVLLDQLRRKRNLLDYEGLDVSEKEAEACKRAAAEICGVAEAWLRAHRPELRE
jgi:hypothetical protein